MTEKIKVKPQRDWVLKVGASERPEGLPTLWPIFSRYFRKGVNHEVFYDPSHIQRGTAYFYCSLNFSPSEETEGKLPKISLTLPRGMEIQNVFYDQTSATYSCPIHQAGIGQDWVELVDQSGRHLGFYLPSQHILWATDWTHHGSEIYGQACRSIIDQLAAIFNWTEIPIEIEEDWKPIPIMLGMDPELELWRDDCLISASQCYEADGEIGADGQGDPIEFRPRPSKNPSTIVKRLRKLISRVLDDGYELDTSGHQLAIGAHIHFGLERSVCPPKELVDLLDDFIGEQSLALSGNARGHYKEFGQFREQPWGFEYRTPPGALLHNPRLCELALKIAHGLVDRFTNKKDEIEYEFPPTPANYVAVAGITEGEAREWLAWCKILKRIITKGKYLLARWDGDRAALLIELLRKTEEGLSEEEVTCLFTAEEIEVARQSGEIVYSEQRRYYHKDMLGVHCLYRDEWADGVKKRLTTELQAALRAIESLPLSLSIVLFGYRANRGLCSNIPIRDWEIVIDESPSGKENSVVRIGLPYAFRNSESTAEEYMNSVVGAIVRYITTLKQTGGLSCVS